MGCTHSPTAKQCPSRAVGFESARSLEVTDDISSQVQVARECNRTEQVASPPPPQLGASGTWSEWTQATLLQQPGPTPGQSIILGKHSHGLC